MSTNHTDAQRLLKARIDRMEIALRQLQADLEEVAMVAGLRAGRASFDEVPPVDLSVLSSRELEIVRHLLQGRRVAQIAKSLYLSPNTVRSHLKSVFRKLGVHSQGELIELCGSRGPSAGLAPPAPAPAASDASSSTSMPKLAAI
ncbi:MAG: LuxR family transcriptional regulator [Deltaproteobacteria bacterium]|nr:MAG: LuxR family transcriptional regulator [Deltaproteobacteria bacterium]